MRTVVRQVVGWLVALGLLGAAPALAQGAPALRLAEVAPIAVDDPNTAISTGGGLTAVRLRTEIRTFRGGRELARWEPFEPARLSLLAVTPDERVLAAEFLGGGAIRVFDAEGHRLPDLTLIQDDGTPLTNMTTLAVAPDGEIFADGSRFARDGRFVGRAITGGLGGPAGSVAFGVSGRRWVIAEGGVLGIDRSRLPFAWLGSPCDPALTCTFGSGSFQLGPGVPQSIAADGTGRLWTTEFDSGGPSGHGKLQVFDRDGSVVASCLSRTRAYSLAPDPGRASVLGLTSRGIVRLSLLARSAPTASPCRPRELTVRLIRARRVSATAVRLTFTTSRPSRVRIAVAQPGPAAPPAFTLAPHTVGRGRHVVTWSGCVTGGCADLQDAAVQLKATDRRGIRADTPFRRLGGR